MMLSKQGRRHRRRSRRARRRGRFIPATATAISTRTRFKGWAVTKSVTRYHRLTKGKYWENYGKRGILE